MHGRKAATDDLNPNPNPEPDLNPNPNPNPDPDPDPNPNQVTGVLDGIERAECKALLARHGGRMTSG